jgi:hypothetical protein
MLALQNACHVQFWVGHTGTVALITKKVAIMKFLSWKFSFMGFLEISRKFWATNVWSYIIHTCIRYPAFQGGAILADMWSLPLCGFNFTDAYNHIHYAAVLIIINNPRRMREGYDSHSVWVSLKYGVMRFPILMVSELYTLCGFSQKLKCFGVICWSPTPSLLGSELSMDKRDSNGFFSTRRVCTASNRSNKTIGLSLIVEHLYC